MKNIISSILTILCMVVIVLGYIIIIGSIIVGMGWLIILAVTLFASGGPAAAVYVQSWPVLLIVFFASIVGLIFVFLGYLLLTIGSLIVSSSLLSGSFSQFPGSYLSNLFPPTGIPGGLESILKGFDPINIFLALLSILFLPDEQKLKLPSNILAILECFKKCLCKYLCGGGLSTPAPPENLRDIIDVAVNTGKVLLDDLKAQYEEAKRKIEELKKKLEELKNKFPNTSFDEWRRYAEELVYWENKLKELAKKIIELGGSV